jgi:hypothetical protein
MCYRPWGITPLAIGAFMRERHFSLRRNSFGVASCPNCDYPASAPLAGFTCPECGIAFTTDSEVFHGGWNYLPRRARAVRVALVLLSSTGLLIGSGIIIKALGLSAWTHAAIALVAVVGLAASLVAGLAQLRRRGAIVGAQGILVFFPDQRFELIRWSEIERINWWGKPGLIRSIRTVNGHVVRCWLIFGFGDVAIRFARSVAANLSASKAPIEGNATR